MSKHQFERTADLPEFCGKCGGLERMSQHAPATIWTCNNCGAELTDTESDSHECAPVTIQAQPTPTPWVVDSDSSNWYVVAKDIALIAILDPYIDQAPAEANARFIVKAVNNHQKLVDAVKQLLEAYAPNAERSAREGGEYCLHTSVQRARAVLAKVQADAD